jgi:hypothetical protein
MVGAEGDCAVSMKNGVIVQTPPPRPIFGPAGEN